MRHFQALWPRFCLPFLVLFVNSFLLYPVKAETLRRRQPWKVLSCPITQVRFQNCQFHPPHRRISLSQNRLILKQDHRTYHFLLAELPESSLWHEVKLYFENPRYTREPHTFLSITSWEPWTPKTAAPKAPPVTLERLFWRVWKISPKGPQLHLKKILVRRTSSQKLQDPLPSFGLKYSLKHKAWQWHLRHEQGLLRPQTSGEKLKKSTSSKPNQELSTSPQGASHD